MKKPDEALGAISENILGYTDFTARLEDPETGVRFDIEELTISTPIELDIVVGPDGKVLLGCAPPLYDVDTTLSPVLHQLRFTAVAEVHDVE